ncbi:MAG: hypothetical protein JNM27_22200 [Leptospirales bacterium]|nr:hypothetical protein [Leptospirales bacterium]
MTAARTTLVILLFLIAISGQKCSTIGDLFFDIHFDSSYVLQGETKIDWNLPDTDPSGNQSFTGTTSDLDIAHSGFHVKMQPSSVQTKQIPRTVELDILFEDERVLKEGKNTQGFFCRAFGMYCDFIFRYRVREGGNEARIIQAGQTYDGEITLTRWSVAMGGRIAGNFHVTGRERDGRPWVINGMFDGITKAKDPLPCFFCTH